MAAALVLRMPRARARAAPSLNVEHTNDVDAIA